LAVVDRSGWQVLIVEDDCDIRQLMGLAIRRLWRCRVVEAADGPEAVALAREAHFDAVFLDLVLPSMPGLEVLKTLKSYPRSAATPVVVISEVCWDRAARSEVLAAGALDCFDKAVLFNSFGEVVRKLLPE
jgi:CheY-like chemotaxis protein